MKNYKLPHNGDTIAVTASFFETTQELNKDGYNESGDLRNTFVVKIRYKGKRTSFAFRDSIHNNRIGIFELDESALRGALELWARDTEFGMGTFEEFCEELDYDTDSRKAHGIWLACAKVAQAAQRMGIDIQELRDALL